MKYIISLLIIITMSQGSQYEILDSKTKRPLKGLGVERIYFPQYNQDKYWIKGKFGYLRDVQKDLLSREAKQRLLRLEHSLKDAKLAIYPYGKYKTLYLRVNKRLYRLDRNIDMGNIGETFNRNINRAVEDGIKLSNKLWNNIESKINKIYINIGGIR